VITLKKILPTGDLAFKKVFASVENTDILGGLINDFFGIKAEEITITDPYSIDTYRNLQSDISELRYALRDVSAIFKTADFISEMQVERNQHFEERLMYYLCTRFCANLGVEGRMKMGRDGKPNRYSSLRPVYALNILDFTHYDDDNPLRVFGFYDHIRHLRPKNEFLHYACFELTKSGMETENQKHWHDYFKLGEVKSEAPDYIRKASEIIDFANLGEEERKMAEALEKARDTMQDELDYSFFEGKKAGIAEMTQAVGMIQNGKPLEDIARSLSLPLDGLRQLYAQLQPN